MKHYYKKCPRCGANLDPCEVCDCLYATEPPEAWGNDELPGAGRVVLTSALLLKLMEGVQTK